MSETASNSENRAEPELLVGVNRHFPPRSRLVGANSARRGRRYDMIVSRIIDIKRFAGLTPEQNRYVDKLVREQLGLQIPKRPRSLPNYLRPSECALLLQEARGASILDGLLVELLLKTGLRINEATMLMAQDLNLDPPHPSLHVVSGKGGRDRHVPLTSDLASKLAIYLNGRRRGRLFLLKNGKAYSKRRLQERVSECIARCGFDRRVRVHDLRHTFATLLRMRGVKLQDIQGLMGHTSIKTTEIYAHLVFTPEQALEFERVMQL